MTQFKVPATFVFKGMFFIKGESRREAEDYVRFHCGFAPGNIHSTLPWEDIDWEFTAYPMRTVGNATVMKD